MFNTVKYFMSLLGIFCTLNSAWSLCGDTSHAYTSDDECKTYCSTSTTCTGPYVYKVTQYPLRAGAAAPVKCQCTSALNSPTSGIPQCSSTKTTGCWNTQIK